MAERRRRATWRGLRLLYRSSPGAVLALVLAQAVDGVAPALVVAASASLLDRAPRGAALPGARGGVVAALVVLCICLVASKVARAFVSLLQHLVAERFRAAVERLRLDAVTRLPGIAHFDDPELADRLHAGGWASEAALIVNYGGFLLRWLSLGAASAGVAARLGWWVPGLLVAATAPAAVLAWRHSGEERRQRQARMDAWRHADYHLGLAVGLDPAREVRLFGMGDWLVDRQAARWADAVALLFADLSRQLRREFVAVAGTVVLGVVPFVVAYHRFEAGGLSVGDFSASIVSLGLVFGVLRWVALFPAELRRATLFLPALFEVVDLPERDPRLHVQGRRPPPPPTMGIRFDGVRFTYPGADTPVLDGLDLWLRAGSSLALVGENGAGKSTVVKLLCRLYDPDAGEITVDGIDIRELDLDAWRQRLAVVFQDFVRLPVSVADNVGVGCIPRLGDRSLLDAAAVQSGAAEVVARLADGWDTVLAPDFGGVDLSGGEWQRVALARSAASRLGRGASVLVLDEPTAALDVRLEHDLFERFGRLGQGATTLLISHRFSTVRMADQVAIMERGAVTEEGTHDELVAAGGRYAELYDLQARRFA